jgi:hypothetical protein
MQYPLKEFEMTIPNQLHQPRLEIDKGLKQKLQFRCSFLEWSQNIWKEQRVAQRLKQQP